AAGRPAARGCLHPARGARGRGPRRPRRRRPLRTLLARPARGARRAVPTLRPGLAVAVAVAIADQASKAAILALFAGAPPDRQFVLAPFLSLLLSRNS